MLAGPLVFVDIDTQRDFLDPEGALAIAGASAIVPNLDRLTRFARSHGIPIVATGCAHTPDEAEPEPFPPHCLVGTPGQRRIEATACDSGRVLSVESTLADSDPLPAHLILEKDRYDVFSRPDAAAIFRRYAADGATFVVYGVATDYCVRAAVLGLLGEGHRVVVVVDAIRAVDARNEAAVLGEFIKRGATLVLTDVVCGDRGAALAQDQGRPDA